MTVTDVKKLNKLWSKSTDLQNPLRERHMFDLAFFLWNNRQFDESVAVSRTLIELMDDRPGESLWIDAMHLQSMALHDAKRDEEAIETELLALEYGETLEPASERAWMHWHLADCYRTTGQPELQEAEYLKAIDAFIESENKWQQGQAYLDLANLHHSARRYEKCKQYLRLAVPVLEQTARTDVMPFVKYRLAGMERLTGNPRAGLALAEEAVALAKFAGDVIAERENTIELALIHSDLENYSTAIELLENLIEDNDDKIKNRTAAKAVYYRAQNLRLMENYEDAVTGYASAIPLLKVVDLVHLAQKAELEIIHLTTW